VTLISPLLQPIPGKDRALPHNGRDAVKIGSTDGGALLRRAGDIRARYTRETGE
jgi:hypothetical protein